MINFPALFYFFYFHPHYSLSTQSKTLITFTINHKLLMGFWGFGVLGFWGQMYLFDVVNNSLL